MSLTDKNYSIIIFTTFTLLICAAMLWNYTNDPYGMWRIAPDKKLDLFWYTRLHKPYRMREVQASRLILGSSRAGRIPAAKLKVDAHVYNAAHPGTTLYEIYRQLEHGHLIQPIDSVIVGLDYYMFRADKEKLIFADFDYRLDRTNTGIPTVIAHHKQKFLDYWRVLVSRSATLASYHAKTNRRASDRRFYPLGSWETDDARSSANQRFAMLGKQKLREFTELSSELNTHYFEKILEFCLASGIAIDVVVSPIHAYQMAIVDQAGQWHNYLAYQRKIVDIAETYKKRGLTLRIFGFEHHTQLVHDSMDEPTWFDDGIHYNRASGKEIVRCLWEVPVDSCDSPLRPHELKPSTLDNYFAVVNNQRLSYQH